MAVKPGLGRRIFQTIGSLRTGIILLILVAIASAAGTVILQRPITEPEQIQATYSPQTLRVLDAVGLTDLYHSWWYLLLMALLAISIVCVSVDRFPNAWRFYSRPYRRTDAYFRAALPLHHSIPVRDGAAALDAAERALKREGLSPERVAEHDEVSLYAEKNRYAVMAVYVVHASLLLIMLGGIVDGIWGYKGYVSLVPGRPPVNSVELRNGQIRRLPFQLGCDEAGQENYTGEFAMMPKRWWSKLVVLADGKEVQRKEIAVNDPLVRNGIRFYQSSYGLSGDLKHARLGIMEPNASKPRQAFDIALGQTVTLDDGRTVTLTKFFPDAYAMDGGIFQRSRDLGNSAAGIHITGKDGKGVDAWLLRANAMPNQVVLSGPVDSTGEPVPGLGFQIVGSLEMQPFTGLQVSHEPGQWAVWGGCLLMALGLLMAFWVLHQRYWVVPVTDKEGRLMLWIGGAANKNREGFAVRFRELADAVEQELKADPAVPTPAQVATAVRG